VEPTDEQLARAAMIGDREAFGALVDRWRTPLIGYLVGILGGRDDAEELAQDAFLRAWRKLPTVRDPACARAWLYRVARNLAMKRRKVLSTVALECDPPERPSLPGEEERLPGLLAAVARLGGNHREVVSRKHFAGQTIDQISRQLGIPAGTVRSRLSRAYAELREILATAETERPASRTPR